MATGFEDLLPVDSDTIDDARERLDADANAGLDPSDADYQDTTPGGIFWDHTQPTLLEVERLRDFMATEMLASALLPLAYGDKLDKWGEALETPRKDEAAALGRVVFTAPNGTAIASGVEVAVQQPSADADPITFATTEGTPVGGVAALAAPASLTRTGAVGGGALPAGTYYYVVTAVVGAGETTRSNEVSITLAGAGRVALAWAEVPGAQSYKVYRGAGAGAEALLAEDVQGTEYNDAGGATTAPTPPVANTTGGAWALPVQAVELGPEGNVGATTISELMSVVDGVTGVSNPYPAGGGVPVETDEAYLGRLLLEYRGAVGSGTVADYARWCLEDPDVGSVTVQPAWNGAGTVRCTLLDPNGDPVPTEVVTRVQNRLDPVPGEGRGIGPIGATVTVTTPTSVPVVVAATVEYETGYSLAGTAGSIATRDQIEAAVAEYIDGLAPGQEVVLNHVRSRFFSVPGVHDVTGLTLNGGGIDIAIGATQVAKLTTPLTLA